jgi:endonuclease/exonuclease/phosphatase family metal-dependent hydrolase
VHAHQHEDMSDHRFEQRGLLHCALNWQGQTLHVVVVHLGLIRASRARQVTQLMDFIAREVPANEPLLVAGDFNDWGLRSTRTLADVGLHSWQAGQHPTFPARLPLVQLDHVYARGLRTTQVDVPRGPAWWRMSDHLPLIVTLERA